ncbi:MAG: hypothetical protein AAF570_28560, partial [Bacteroidota bacterium]
MKIGDIKGQLLAERFQAAVLASDGTLLESCDALMDLRGYMGQDILSEIPIFIGLRHAILTLQDEVFRIPMIQFEFEGKTHIYSFEFRKDADTGNVIWLIFNNSDF